MLTAQGDFVSAEPLLIEAIALQIRRLGPNHPAVATTLARQARLQLELKRPADARATWERALAIRREPDASPRYLGQALCEYGSFLFAIQAPEEARAAYGEAIEVLRSLHSERSSMLALAELGYGELLLASGDAAGARPHLAEAVSMLAAASAGGSEDLASAQDALKRCEAQIGH
jgi:serine/threonine-protein kinase